MPDDNEPDLLKIAESRLSQFHPSTWNTQDLLLLDIARSLREQLVLAKVGLDFSHELARQFDRP